MQFALELFYQTKLFCIFDVSIIIAAAHYFLRFIDFINTINMKKLLLVFCLVTSGLLNAQTYTWTNGGGDNDFDNGLNWNPTPPFGGPSFGESAVFDGTSSNANCNMLNAEDFVNLTMLSSYTGTVNATTDLNITTLNMQGGTFIAPSSTMNLLGNIAKGAGATFIHSNGMVDMELNSSGARQISGSITFSNLTISTSGGGTLNRTIIFGNSTSTCSSLTFNGGTYPMCYKGIINVTSGLTVSGSTTAAAPSNTGGVIFVGNGAKTITGTGSALQNPIANITFNTTGAVNMSGNLTIAATTSGGAASAGTWSVASIGTYNAGSSTVNFTDGTITSGSTATTRAYFDNLTVPSSGTMVISGSSQVEVEGNITNNGAITANTSLIRFGNTGAAQSLSGSSTTTLNAIDVSTSGTKSINSALFILDSVGVTGAGTLASGGNITLVSTSSLKGRIGRVAGSISGNMTVQTFALGGTTDWAVLGVSGIQGQTFNNWYGQIPMAIEGSSTGVTSVGGQYFESVQGWNEADAYGYDTTIVVTSPISVGKGYWVFLGNGLGNTGNMTWNVSGSPVTGSVLMPLTNSAQSGYNLVANPYASPISWAKLRNGNGSVANAIYIYNADLGTTTSYVNGVSSHPGQGANDVIPMGQGFYVQATGNTNLTAQESNKVTSNTSANQLLKTTSNNQPAVLNLRLDSPYDWDQTAVNFEPASTNNFDLEYDAHKWFNSPGYAGYPGVWSARTSISSHLGNDEYSINSLPITGQNVVIPVRALAYYSGQHTITALGLQNIPNNACVTLTDKATNTIHDLRSGPYTFSMQDTTAAARFELNVCAAVITGIKQQQQNNGSVMIGPDKNGVTVSLDFPASTEALISVTNILGEKVLADKKVVTTAEDVRLDLSSFHNQVLIISVKTSNSMTTKKIIR
jgi:hypothetical protein